METIDLDYLTFVLILATDGQTNGQTDRQDCCVKLLAQRLCVLSPRFMS